MLGFANIYSIYLSVYQLLICYFLLKPRDIIITKFDEEPLHFPEITVFLFPVYNEVYFNSDNEHLPDHIQLASRLNLNQAKMNKLLRELLDKILHGLYDHPLLVKDKVHILHIWPFIEPEDENKEWAKLQWKRAITIPVDLPETPRFGDNLEIPFIRISYSSGSDDKLHYGVVHEIRHIVRGTIQEIHLYIYPHKNIYYKWQEMKEEYEKHKRWLAWLKSESDRT